jgi:isopenicillin N synthase-like dioxygenase
MLCTMLARLRQSQTGFNRDNAFCDKLTIYQPQLSYAHIVEPVRNLTPDPERIALRVRQTGTARVQLADPALTALARLRAVAAEFFAQPDAVKQEHRAGGPLQAGWHPYATRYATHAGWPDQDEIFTWHGTTRTDIPGWQKIPRLCNHLAAYQSAMSALTGVVLGQIGAHYGYPRPLVTAPYSHLEVNWYGTPPRAAWPYLQERHEDGHVLSLAAPNRPGLQLEVDDRMRDVDAVDGQVVIMAGSVLTAMTGGDIPPLYHRVVNLGCEDRMTVMYFADLDSQPGTVMPFRHSSYNAGMDMATMGRSGCSTRCKQPVRVIWLSLRHFDDYGGYDDLYVTVTARGTSHVRRIPGQCAGMGAGA